MIEEREKLSTDGATGGTQPLFLFSLPRSGSTLAQRILAAHESIDTTSEPWVLLPYFYTLRDRGVYAEYNHSSLVAAVEDFYGTLPGGREDYVVELRELALRLYRKAASDDARYFLDKTPRYHLISGDLLRAFPDCKHLFLWRNPLAVISSIIETWGGGKWNLYRHKVDLFDGLEELIKTYEANEQTIHAVRYEDLLTKPEETWSGIFRYLEVPFDASLLQSFGSVRLNGRKGDPTGTGKYHRVNQEPLERWRSVLGSPARKAWCRSYLRWLGRERLAIMGYDMDLLLENLDSLPTSYGTLASDVWRGSYGLAYDLLEPKIFREKLGRVAYWRQVHPHKWTNLSRSSALGERLKDRALLYTGRHPSLFFGFYSARRRYRDLLVDGETRLVIEGFPRSGNTFAVFAFRYAQQSDVRIAHHLHAPAQIMRASRMGIPALLLLREPLDAVMSLMLRDPSFSAERALRYYVTFYETATDYRDDFVVGPFEEVTNDYGDVIRRINTRFGTKFVPFEHTEQNVERVFDRIEESHRARRRDRVMEEQIARPSTARAELKDQLKSSLYSPELEPWIYRASAVYKGLLN